MQLALMLMVVEYSVAVLCIVDTDSGDIHAVRVADDEIRATGFVFDERGEPTTGPVDEKARGIADTREWPRWQFGA